MEVKVLREMKPKKNRVIQKVTDSKINSRIYHKSWSNVSRSLAGQVLGV